MIRSIEAITAKMERSIEMMSNTFVHEGNWHPTQPGCVYVCRFMYICVFEKERKIICIQIHKYLKHFNILYITYI